MVEDGCLRAEARCQKSEYGKIPSFVLEEGLEDCHPVVVEGSLPAIQR